ncbi:MAG: leucine-rich repeat domain-containing protein [Candidatus Hermodarchaeota archaeon]
MSVTYLDKKYQMENKKGFFTLDLSGRGITDITEIKDLEVLTELQVLNLSKNQISEIKGLETLKNLVELDLSNNQIAKIQGLANLTNLKKLNLKKNRFINIEGFENLINLEKLIFGFESWVSPNWSPKGNNPFSSAKKTLLLNGRELTVLEKKIVKGEAKKVVAYCRVQLKQAGYTKSLVPADARMEKLEKKIIKMIQDNEKKIQKATKFKVESKSWAEERQRRSSYRLP